MSLLIDGYNLLHASGILGGGVGPGGLERSRAALLNFLAESLDPADVRHTVVVFDAGANSRGLPRSYEHRGLTVTFSSGHADADELIEQLIRRDSTPRRLTVVSSDHRLQRAAKRRKAHAIDSDKWFAAVLRNRIDRRRLDPPVPKPPAPLDEYQVQFWLKKFGVEDAGPVADPPSRDSLPAAADPRAVGNAPHAAEKPTAAPPATHAPPTDELPVKDAPKRVSTPRRSRKPPESTFNSAMPGNPFPPGYGEDVSEEDV